MMWLRKQYIFLLISLIGWASCRNCSQLEFRKSDAQIIASLKNSQQPFSIEYYKSQSTTIRFLKVGEDSLPKIILIHGSPSSLSSWQPIYTDAAFIKRYQIIAIDRPGYGYSNFGTVITNLQQQVNTIQPLIDSLTTNTKAILVGSSYGGPVAAQLAMNLPNRFEQLVLLSAAVKPGSEKTYWISYPMVMPFVSLLFSPGLVMPSEEKLTHREQLEQLRNWNKINTDVVIIHGNKDDLIYYDNATYAKAKLHNAHSVKLITMSGKGHAIIFSQPDFLKKIFHQFLKHQL
jgi:pimeloyl-ACP methyl ester carboxylesterase